VNLELAKMFIDQLAMIQEKTRGNLTNEESTVLRNALSNLQMAYVEVAREAPKGAAQRAGQPVPSPEPAEQTRTSAAEPSAPITPPNPKRNRKRNSPKCYGRTAVEGRFSGLIMD
jgi:hypothetical protein